MDEEHSHLKLPEQSASDGELEALSTLRHVKDKLKTMGVEEPVEPDFKIPDLPTDISAMTDREIGDLYAKLLEWDNYFTLQTAWADAEAKEAKNKLQLIIMKVSGGKKKKTYEYDNDSRVLEARAEVQGCEQVSMILEATHKTFSAKLRMVSRNIELRKLEWEKNHRGSGIRMPHDRMGGRRK
jgi:hypothetical protein